MGVVRAHAAGPVPGGGTQVVQRSPLPQPPPPSGVDDALHESPTSAAPDAAPNNEAMAVPSTRRKHRCRRTVATAIVYRVPWLRSVLPREGSVRHVRAWTSS
jgi:hypothetical protein